MRRRSAALIAIVMTAALMLVPASAEQPSGGKGGKCPVCGGTGKVPDPDCPKPSPYRWCTYTFKKYKSHGFGFLVCPACHGAQAEWDELMKEYKAWLEKRRERIDKMVFGDDWEEHHIEHVEGRHFVVSGTIRPGIVYLGKKRVKMSAMDRAHLFLDRAEDLFENHFLPLLGLKEYTPEKKWEITMWSRTDELLTAGSRLVGITQDCISTFQARLITVPDRGGDKSLYQAIVFNLGLLMVEEYKGFVEGGLPDWFWEGFAHYLEYEIFDNVANNCNDEALGTSGLTGRHLRKRVKTLVKRKRYPKITDFGELNVSRLGAMERLVAWSLIDWIKNAYGPKKLELFIRIVKRTKSQAQAFRDAIGVKYTDVMDEWAAWVKENY